MASSSLLPSCFESGARTKLWQVESRAGSPLDLTLGHIYPKRNFLIKWKEQQQQTGQAFLIASFVSAFFIPNNADLDNFTDFAKLCEALETSSDSVEVSKGAACLSNRCNEFFLQTSQLSRRCALLSSLSLTLVLHSTYNTYKLQHSALIQPPLSVHFLMIEYAKLDFSRQCCR